MKTTQNKQVLAYTSAHDIVFKLHVRNILPDIASYALAYFVDAGISLLYKIILTFFRRGYDRLRNRFYVVFYI